MISDSNSYRKNERAARAIEQSLGLDAPTPRAPEDRYPRASGVKAERGRRRFERLAASVPTHDQTTKKGKRMIDPSIIFSAIDEAAGLDDLKKRLAERSIECQFVQAPGAAGPTGWLLRQAGAAGTWLKGSDVARGLSIKKVQERIEQRRRERQARLARELLGDLLDEAAEKTEQEDEERLVAQQRSLLAALLHVSSEALRHLIAALSNSIAALLERLFGLREGSLGRIEVAEGGEPRAVAPAAPQADATTQQVAKLAAGQKILARALARIVESIREGDPSLLPAARSKDPGVAAARTAVIDKVEEELEAADDQDDESYERDRPR